MPVALTLAVSGLFWGYLGFGAGLFDLLPARIFGVTANYTLIAIPLFVFMGVMLEKSKLAEDLMDVIGHLAGGLRGGLGIGIILVGVLMGATTGIVGATVVTLGLITLPALMRRGYDLPTACGTICASGTLGPDHPAEPHPDPARRHPQPIGRHAVRRRDDPGPDAVRASSSSIFCCSASCGPNMVPPVALEERRPCRGRELCSSCAARRPAADRLVLAVLGSIIGGIAAPTEAASMGALGSIVVTAHGGPLQLLGAARDRRYATTRITADDVHPDLRAGVRAGVPRPAGREAGPGSVHLSCPAASTAS